MRAQAASSAETVELNGAITATLTLLTDCPPAARDVDVVLAFDQSRSMEGLPIESIIAAAERFIERVRLDRSRVAIMMFASDVDMRTGLIQDREGLLSALRPMNYGGDTSLALAIDTARLVLDDRRPDAMPAMVLLTDGQVRDDPLPAAAWAKAAGIRIAVVCFSPTHDCDDEVFEVASTQYLFLAKDESELFEAYDALGEYMAQPDVQRLSVTLEPSAGLPYTGLTRHRNPPERGADGLLAWTRAEPLAGAAVLALPLSAAAVGSWPLAEGASAYYVDSDGGVGAVTIPLPRVDVTPPQPTGPCAPAAARSVEPTRVRAREVVTVTSTLDVSCGPTDTKLDVSFAIDHSFSMGTLGRLDNAVRAVDQFLLAVDDADAWHGLVAFNERITHRVPVGADPDAVRSALATLQPDGGTDIGRAIDASLDQLRAGREGSRKVMVVLTDGANSASGMPILDGAGKAQEAGVLLVTVCAGGQCDPDLALAATGPEYAFSVADAGGLSDVFARLAGVVTRVEPASIELQEFVTPGFAFRWGAPVPVPAPWDPSLWLWTFAAPGDGGATVTHSLDALKPGRRPVAINALVRYSLDGGETGEFYLPAAEVEVQPVEPEGLPTALPLPTPGTPAPSRSMFLPHVAVP
jgi:Mg-chelatase subunit ChlD